MRRTVGKRSSPGFLIPQYVLNMCSICRPLWRVRRQSDNPFPLKLSAASRDRFLRWQRWFVFVLLLGYVRPVPLCRLLLYHGICLPACLSWKDESSLPSHKSIWHAVVGMDGNELSAWRVKCYKMRTHTAVCGIKKNWRVFLSIFRSHWHCFPPSRCTYFMKCVRALWYDMIIMIYDTIYDIWYTVKPA